MAQPYSTGSQPAWTWDARRQLYYYWDSQSDQLIYTDGLCVPRPSTVPRTFYEQQNALAQQSPQYGSAVSTNNYTNTPGSPGYIAQSTAYRQTPQYLHLHGQTPRSPQAGPSHAQSSASSVQPQQQAVPALPLSVHRDSYVQDGVHFVRTFSSASQVQTTVGLRPPERITDQELYHAGGHAHGLLRGDERVEEPLYSSYRVRPSVFFTVGRVFQILWTEPAGATGTQITAFEANDRNGNSQDDRSALSTVRFGERVYSKIRRFVVVRGSDRYCSALPIMTYGGQGVAKAGVNKSEHAIIYTGHRAPRPTSQERPTQGQAAMRPLPIRVDADNHEQLHFMSRIHFGKVYTVEHNVKVKPFGKVHPHSLRALEVQFRSVFSGQGDDEEDSSSEDSDDGDDPNEMQAGNHEA
ncbi:hypothetical protein KC343_g3901 [Hortaea werneckii]|uniref:DUF6590 domain-containing protein n=1 Tax=Hortaea werneckii TaxID=91943 RepID=A0A3M7G2X8_HORWE|nr:hypothetical protein KC323_g1735 [Hortaea werneckii]KAI7257461.1 hypothetical protein KC352_g10923 [Hortaea werneckii]KAI7568025.1 hypothetical protein KC317_g4556 [Hortaea werneckii]KAI7622902.1 hypothetical protein KC346_g2983 [Hortaea werneckii]KAI7631630.1 hypothetical protein KC343_g3901 [Hortaea werneckii]